MAITAAIVGGVLAAGTIGTQAYAASKSGGGGSARQAPRFAQTPEPAYERALRSYTSRLLAQGATVTPPSFLDYVKSGGTLTFPLGNTAMTPGEAVGLKEVGAGGQPVPYFQPGQKQLTPEQIMYIAKTSGPGAPGAPSGLSTSQIRREARELTRLGKLGGLPQTEQRQKREERIKGRLGRQGVEGY